MYDFAPATGRLAALVEAVDDEQLGAPTPCDQYSVGDLLDHIDGLSLAFAAAARKDTAGAPAGPSADASRLGDDWRTRIPVRLTALAEAWQDPEAWSGSTSVVGLEFPGPVAATFGFTEVVLHGWDLARAVGQAYALDKPALDVCLPHVRAIAASGPQPGLFGPQVPVADDASEFDQLLSASGRDPAWTP